MLLGLAQGVMLWWQLWRLRSLNAFGYGQLLITLSAFLAVMLEQWCVYGGLWREFPHLLRSTVWMPLLFGPGLWLYVQSLQRSQWRWRDAWHYLPALLAFLYMLPYWLQSGSAKLEQVYHTTSIPLETSIFGAIKAVSLLGYVIAIVLWLRRRRQQNPQQGRDRLSARFYYASLTFLLFLLVLLLVFVAEHWWGDLALPSDVLAVLGLAAFLYGISLIAVAHWREFAQSLAPVNLPATVTVGQANEASVAATPAEKAEREALLADDTAKRIFQHVHEQVLQRELFRQAGLRLDELATAVQVPAHYLSYVVNRCSGRNVQSWLNLLRVQAAQTALAQPGDLNVLAIGLAAGFNSKATFNRAFKQETGDSPSEYRQRHLSETQPPASP